VGGRVDPSDNMSQENCKTNEMGEILFDKVGKETGLQMDLCMYCREKGK